MKNILLQTIGSSFGLIKDKTVQLILAISILLMAGSHCYGVYIDKQIQLEVIKSERMIQSCQKQLEVQQIKHTQLRDVLFASNNIAYSTTRLPKL